MSASRNAHWPAPACTYRNTFHSRAMSYPPITIHHPRHHHRHLHHPHPTTPWQPAIESGQTEIQMPQMPASSALACGHRGQPSIDLPWLTATGVRDCLQQKINVADVAIISCISCTRRSVAFWVRHLLLSQCTRPTWRIFGFMRFIHTSHPEASRWIRRLIPREELVISHTRRAPQRHTPLSWNLTSSLSPPHL